MKDWDEAGVNQRLDKAVKTVAQSWLVKALSEGNSDPDIDPCPNCGRLVYVGICCEYAIEKRMKVKNGLL